MSKHIESLRDIFNAILEETGYSEYLLLREVFLLCMQNEYYPSWFADWCSEFGQCLRANVDEKTYKEEGGVVYSEGIKHCTNESTRQHLESLLVDIIKPVTDPQRIYG